MGFASSIKAFNKKVTQEVSDSVVEIANELFTEIVKETPVDKGVLINNWYVGKGRGVYNGAYDANSANPDGMSSLNQISSLRGYTGFLGRDGAVSLSNSTPYGFRAEYAGWPKPEWTGRIGPYAMIAKAFIK
jgi:hypothetical protein